MQEKLYANEKATNKSGFLHAFFISVRVVIARDYVARIINPLLFFLGREAEILLLFMGYQILEMPIISHGPRLS